MIFQIIAIIIIIIFYSTYFGKKIHQKKQGIKTDLLGKDKTGLVLFIECTLKIMSFVIVIAELVTIFLNANSAPLIVRILGILLSVIGNITFILAIVTMKDSWRAGVPKNQKTDLITNGIFQYSRNPAFLGFYLIYIGILMMFFNWWLLIITILMILIFHLQVVYVEEKFLTIAFGDEYIVYKNKVNRYIGRKK